MTTWKQRDPVPRGDVQLRVRSLGEATVGPVMGVSCMVCDSREAIYSVEARDNRGISRYPVCQTCGVEYGAKKIDDLLGDDDA